MKLLLVIVLTILAPFAEAAPGRLGLAYKAGVVARECAPGAPAPSPSPLGLAIDALETRWGSAAARARDPRGFVAALDHVISLSRFAPLLACRAAVSPRYAYRVSFQPVARGEQDMEVGVSGRRLTLSFNLVKSVSRVLFVYIHELTHVCQTRENDRLFDEGRRAAIAQGFFLDEIEAFHMMDLAFVDFSRASHAVCAEPGDSEFFKVYTDDEADLLGGVFAQRIVEDYADQYPFKRSDLLGARGGLNLEFTRKIEKLGVPVSVQ